MAADVAVDPPPANPCCAQLKKRYLKLEEKRSALREAVRLLEGETKKLQNENTALKRAYDEEHKRADLAQQEKEKESDIKSILEKEIRDLKSEIASLQENGNLRDQDRNQQLETRILQGEVEIKRLKELLQKEIKRGESEKKKVVEEKRKAAEAWRQVKIENNKAEEEKRTADMERKKAEDMRLSLAKSKLEASEAREKLTEERLKAEAANNKVELEKQKANREKKRADSERARAEDQRKLVEIEKKKLVDEKNRADHLSQELEEERRKREELQTDMEGILYTGQGLKSCLRNYKTKQISSSNEDAESANMKLLKKKLKLQRDQLKHAKRMAKLDRAEKRLLLQQLYLLKQDHIQFSRRLETLINCSSYGMESTDGLAKVDDSLKQCAKKCAIGPQRKYVCAEQDFNSQIETKANCTTMKYMGPIIPCMWRLPQKCGGRSTKPISGISSDLESPVGDSVRDKSQNSEICSTAVTYSDAQLMGSQGRSAFAVATSAKLVKDNFQGTPLNLAEETENLHVAQQNNDASIFHRETEFPCLNSVVCNGVEVAPSDSQCNRGKRKSQVILDAEDCGCCLKIDNNNSLLEDINSKSFIPSLCRSDDIYSLNARKSFTTELSDDSDTRNCKFHMMEKSRKRQILGSQPSDRIDNHNEVDGYNETCFVSEAALPFLDAKGHALTWKNKSGVVTNDQAAPVCLEKIIAEDYMKLLELDDAADEERYRAARERPLSPTLPELESPRRSHSDDDCLNFTCGAFGGTCETEKGKLAFMIESNRLNYHSAASSQEELDSRLIPENVNPGDTSEEINRASLLKSSSECSQLPLDRCVHMGSSSDASAVVNQTSHALGTCHVSDLGLINLTKQSGGEPCTQGASRHMILDNILERKVAMDKENDLSIDKGAPQADIDWESRSSMNMETTNQMSLSKAKDLICLNGADGHEHWGVHGCCVVFSNTKDVKVISRILCARNAMICDTSRGSGAGFSVAMVLHALAANAELSSEEKACVLFSFLLCKVSAIPADSAIHMVGDLSSKSESVIAEMDKVISDKEMRSIFLATWLLDIFVSLIQDFLTSRKVMICEDTLCERSDLRTSDNVHCLDNGNRTWTLRTAALNQLVAGSVILASVITLHECVDILWQTSFQLLRMCRGDSYWILTAVHVFASICGEKFFSPTDHNLTVTAIKSLVLLLERGEESGGVTSNGDKGPKFCVCLECPFAEGEVCVDKVTSWLLEELKTCISCATRHQDCKELVVSLYNTHPECISRADGTGAHNTQFDGSSKECHAGCSLHNFAHQVDQNADTGFCHFTDIVSLVELFGYYMGWKCLHSKIIQRLFTLLESCLSSAFSVSLLVLVGRLGRIGIEAGGREQTDVEGLMCSLSTFLDMDKAGKSGLPVQFAAVDALLNLLPLDFREIVEGPLNISVVTNHVVHVEHIRRWFNQLGEEQKAVSLRLFQNSDVKKS